MTEFSVYDMYIEFESLKFEWDDNKNITNISKHNVDFLEAVSVFYDEDALVESDVVHSIEEERFKILGLSEKGRLLLVIHCLREGSVIRIISSRKASKKERECYYDR